MTKVVLAGALAAILSLSSISVARAASFEEAEKLIDKAEYADALKVIGELSSGAGAARAALLQGEVELRTGKYDEASRSAEKASKDSALEPAAAALRAEALAARGKLADAIAVLKKV